jgi:hypothetical protein
MRSRTLSKRIVVLLAAAAAAVVMLAAAGVAWAQSPTLNQTPDNIWMTNSGGKVFAVVRSGDYIYVGGQFTSIRSGPTGQSFAATNLARFHADTGVGDPTWTPDVTGADMTVTTVYSLAASNGKIFVGGKFGAVNGIPRRNFAAVSPDTGAVDPTIDPVVGTEASIVRAMVASGTKVYIGGAFGTVQDDTGTKGRNNLAAINPVSGNVDLTWKPRADKIVWSLAFSCDGSEVFAGGKFLNAAGSDGVFSARMVIARFDATSGSLHRWAIPASTFESVDPGFVASDMAVTCERITSGFLGHPNWVRSFRLDNGETGSMAWGYRTGGDVQAVTMLGPDKVIIGGHFKWVKDRVPRTRIAMVNLSDGSADPSWNVALTAGSTKAIGPWDLLVDENHLYVGGHFTEVRTGSSVINQTGFTRFTFAP